MHNGMIKTLEAVADFYNQGGGKDSNKSKLLKPLDLSWQERGDLVEFLKALSGDPLTSDKYVWKEKFPEEYDVIPNWRDAKN